jgi:imidazoleglycerol-phosphate dehydratase
MSAARVGRVRRDTRETQLELELELDGGNVEVTTGLPFFDHLLEQIARHGRLGLRVHAVGDVLVDAHHLTEDVGIAFGQALDDALGERVGIERFGQATVPLDETLIEVALDLSGRGGAWVELGGERALGLGTPPVATEHVEEFLAGLARTGRLTLHVRSLRGHNTHHQLEATAKALGRALRAAVAPSGDAIIPSTKGSL